MIINKKPVWIAFWSWNMPENRSTVWKLFASSKSAARTKSRENRARIVTSRKRNVQRYMKITQWHTNDVIANLSKICPTLWRHQYKSHLNEGLLVLSQFWCLSGKRSVEPENLLNIFVSTDLFIQRCLFLNKLGFHAIGY